MPDEDLEIVLGSYEEFILGYKYRSKKSKSVQTFASHSHTSSIRCLALHGTLLASGGADDRIVIYDLKSRAVKCTLDHHNDTVNCIQFTNNHSHVISGGADGVLAIVRVGSWILEKMWNKAHKGMPIIDIAIHQSGKLALTLGGDHTLRTWNLIKGRQAFAVNLNSKSSDAKSLQSIKWAPNDKNFVLAGGKFTEIWSIESGGITTSIEHEEKVICCAWKSDDILIVGYENGKIGVVDIKTKEVQMYEGHNSRIRDMALYKNYVITACSNGEVKIWTEQFDEISKFDTGCRLTCLSVISSLALNIDNQTQSKKRDESMLVKEKRKIEDAVDVNKLTSKKKKRQSKAT